MSMGASDPTWTCSPKLPSLYAMGPATMRSGVPPWRGPPSGATASGSRLTSRAISSYTNSWPERVKADESHETSTRAASPSSHKGDSHGGEVQRIIVDDSAVAFVG